MVLSNDTYIKNLPLSKRAKNALIAYNIHTLKTLNELPILELNKIPNIGEKTLLEIKNLIVGNEKNINESVIKPLEIECLDNNNLQEVINTDIDFILTRYGQIFTKYKWFEYVFMFVFNEDEEVYNILNSKLKVGKKSLKSALDERNLDIDEVNRLDIFLNVKSKERKKDIDIRLRNLLVSNAPIGKFALAEIYAKTYGDDKEVVIKNYLKSIDKYYIIGYYRLDFIKTEDKEAIQVYKKMTKDIYMRREILEIYKQLYPMALNNYDNFKLLKEFGFEYNHGKYIRSKLLEPLNLNDYVESIT